MLLRRVLVCSLLFGSSLVFAGGDTLHSAPLLAYQLDAAYGTGGIVQFPGWDQVVSTATFQTGAAAGDSLIQLRRSVTNGSHELALARLTADGQIDRSFNSTGTTPGILELGAGDALAPLTLRQSGKFLVGNRQYTATGGPDVAFGFNGWLSHDGTVPIGSGYGAIFESSAQRLFAVTATPSSVCTYSAFDDTGRIGVTTIITMQWCDSVAVTSAADGSSLLLVSRQNHWAIPNELSIARISPSGDLIPPAGPGTPTVVTAQVNAPGSPMTGATLPPRAVLTDGADHVLLSLDTGSIVRLSLDGTLDPTYGVDARALTLSTAYTILRHADGSIGVLDRELDLQYSPHQVLRRFDATGRPTTDFTSSPPFGEVTLTSELGVQLEPAALSHLTNSNRFIAGVYTESTTTATVVGLKLAPKPLIPPPPAIVSPAHAYQQAERGGQCQVPGLGPIPTPRPVTICLKPTGR